MSANPIIQAMLEAASKAQGHDGKLTEEAVQAVFAKTWNDDITLEVLANDCPPEVRAIMMKRVKELLKKKPFWKRF